MLAALLSLSGVASAAGSAGPPLPIIDMHLHATDTGAPMALCVPWVSQFPDWDRRSDWSERWMAAMRLPTCADPIPAPQGAGAARKATLAAMEKHNIYGVLTGRPEELDRWTAAAPGRFIPSLRFRLGQDHATPAEIAALHQAGRIEALGEILNQYAGIAPNDERMAPYWALAEERDIPVAIHMGEGTVGTAYLGESYATYRAALSNPFLLEDVLVRHPKLRIYVMHYAAPLVDEMIAVLASHPQVYVDIGGIQWYYPRAFFYAHLEKFIDAGFGRRVMFGSDQGDWPGVIEHSIEVIEEAPFLSEAQKRDIFYNNAARFLGLDEDEIRRHHAGVAVRGEEASHGAQLRD